jgi:hypothetical protein
MKRTARTATRTATTSAATATTSVMTVEKLTALTRVAYGSPVGITPQRATACARSRPGNLAKLVAGGGVEPPYQPYHGCRLPRVDNPHSSSAHDPHDCPDGAAESPTHPHDHETSRERLFALAVVKLRHIERRDSHPRDRRPSTTRTQSRPRVYGRVSHDGARARERIRLSRQYLGLYRYRNARTIFQPRRSAATPRTTSQA